MRAERAFDGAVPSGSVRYRIAVGHEHGVQPGNIVGAIANEADLESRFIGRIDIHDDHSVLDLPEGMPEETMRHLQVVRVAGQALRLHKLGSTPPAGARPSGPRGAGPRPRPPARAPKTHRKGPRPSSD